MTTTLESLEVLPIPAENRFGRKTQAWEVREIERLRAKLVDPAHAVVRNGVRYWLISDGTERVVPTFVYKDALAACPPEQQAAYDADMAAFTAAYRRQQANHEPSEEEKFEMRAAFGPGQTVVNVISGRKYRT